MTAVFFLQFFDFIALTFDKLWMRAHDYFIWQGKNIFQDSVDACLQNIAGMPGRSNQELFLITFLLRRYPSIITFQFLQPTITNIYQTFGRQVVYFFGLSYFFNMVRPYTKDGVIVIKCSMVILQMYAVNGMKHVNMVHRMIRAFNMMPIKIRHSQDEYPGIDERKNERDEFIDIKGYYSIITYIQNRVFRIYI